MPAFETMDLVDAAVLWAVDGEDPDFGTPVVAAPIQIACRWVGSATKMEDDKGNTITFDTAVVVAQDIAPGSIMWLGALAEWNAFGQPGFDPEFFDTAFFDPGNPGEPIPSGLMEVKLFRKTRDLKGRLIRRTVGLMRATDTVPLG